MRTLAIIATLMVLVSTVGCGGGKIETKGTVIWQGAGFDNTHSGIGKGELFVPFGAEWKTELGGVGFGAFCVAEVPDIPLRNDKLVAELVITATKDGYVYAMDWQTGEIMWHQKLPSQAGDPIYVNGKVVVSCADGTWNCLSAWDGKTIWTSKYFTENQSLDPIWKGRAENAAPVTDGVNVYAAHSTKTVKAFSLEDGSEKWSSRLDDAIMASPVLIGSTLIVADYSQKLTAIDTKTGKTIWSQGIDDKVTTSLVSDGKTVFVPGSFGKMASYNVADGKKGWTLDNGGTIPYTPCISGNRLVVANGMKNTIEFVTLDTGVIKETYKLDKVEVGSALVSSDNYVCFGTTKGGIGCVDLLKKVVVQAYSFDTQKVLGAIRSYGSPAITSGRLIISDGLSTAYMLAPKDYVDQLNKKNHPVQEEKKDTVPETKTPENKKPIPTPQKPKDL